MQRFYTSPENAHFEISSDQIEISAKLDPELYHQITRVLRSQIGEKCIFFRGEGIDYVYEIETIDKHGVRLRLVERLQKDRIDEPRITLYQSIPNKLEKVEFILQKGVEVGVTKFVFFKAERSQKLAALESVNGRKRERLEQIVQEAAEQSGTDRIPAIEVLDRLPTVPIGSLVAHTDWKRVKIRDLKASTVSNPELALWIGPEGGFSPSEIKKFQDSNSVFLDLGERTLRTETAGMVVTFALLQK